MGLMQWDPLREVSDAQLAAYKREWCAMRDKCGWRRWSEVPPAWRIAGEDLMEEQLQRIEQLKLF